MKATEIPQLANKILELDLHHDLVCEDIGCNEIELKLAWFLVQEYHQNRKEK